MKKLFTTPFAKLKSSKLSNGLNTIGGNLFGFFIKLSKKWMSKPLLKKVLYTLLLILIFRIAASITIPGIKVGNSFAKDSASFTGILDMMGGGALRSFSIVALGIGPYITASIIMQLLQSEVFPPLYRLSQAGPAGKRKINVITRVLTLIFAFIQAITLIQSLTNGNGVEVIPALDTKWFKFFVLPVILMSGSLFALFLGEQITSNGVGNGTSLIIFSGIAAGLPGKFKSAFQQLANASGGTAFIGVMNFLLYVLVFLGLIFLIGFLYRAERHIPIQQVGSGMTSDVNQMSRLPIKLNPAGVMPIIFALTISILPLTIGQFFNKQDLGRQWIENHMRLTHPLGLIIFVALIFIFTIVMSIVTFNPTRVSDNFKKNGTFIPGIRPGEDTEAYLNKVVIRLSIFSAIYLSAISSIQYIEQVIGLSANVTFGGTTLIILVTVAIETIGQLKARDKTNKISKAKVRTLSSTKKKGDTTGGLLW